MLKVRIIPTLLYSSSALVKGVSFDAWRVVDTVLPAIKVYNIREVDELILLDINATLNGTSPEFESIKEFSKECFVPFCVGGGIKTVDDIIQLLRSGADKVCINTEAYHNINLISESAKLFGSQCIVSSIDCKKIGNRYYCFSNNGKINTGILLEEWAKRVEEAGSGEIIITSIDNDGTMQGYDLDMIKKITDIVKIPVIASGGAGNYEDMYRAISNSNASAVAAASIFHFTQDTPKEAKLYLKEKGIPVRL